MKKKASDYYLSLKFTPEKAGLLFANLFLAAFEGFFFAEMLRRLLVCLMGQDPEGVKRLFLVIAAAGVLYLLCHFLESCLAFRFRRGMQFACQDELFERYMDSQGWSEGFVNQVLAQMMTSLPAFAADTAAFFRAVVRQVFLMVFSCAYILSVSPLILAVGILMCLVFMLMIRQFTGQMTERSREYMQENDHVYAMLKEQVKNREIAAYMNNERVTGGLQQAGVRMLASLLRLKKAGNLVELFSVGCSLFLFLASSVLGGFFVLKGRLTADALAAVLLVIPNLSSGLFSLPGLQSKEKQCLGQRQHYESFLGSEWFAVPAGERWDPRKEEKDRFESVALRGLSYETPEGKRILDSVRTELPCGQFLCLAGASGCGKTTLLNILGKQYPCEGAEEAVLLGRCSLTGIDRDDYWGQVLYLNNRQEILNQSILYNITLSEEPAEEARLRRALRLADLEGWFAKTGGDFQAVLKKEQLSSGERQKIAMARFFYRDCLGGLFDEITSAMDADSEKRIIQNLKSWVREDSRRFVLFVSHRQQPLAEADRVYYMEAGRLAAEGSHEELLSCPGYSRLLEKEA